MELSRCIRDFRNQQLRRMQLLLQGLVCLGWAERMGSISNGQELAITDIFFRSEIGFDEGAKGLSPIGFNIITGEQRELVYSVFTFVVYHYGS